MYYFSENATEEITKIVDKILVLFPKTVQKKLSNFVAEISQNRCCDLNQYNEIISLLQNEEKKKKPKIEMKNLEIKNEEEKKYQNLIKQSEYLTVMFMTGAFVSKNNEPHIQKGIVQEVRR